ncbi:hypothetical protein B0H13DRAFT_1872356 [Mycena leptocephala]|nr:hypothetical protein B0H13DRAFT_1872356 [Mycena leptocephala]
MPCTPSNNAASATGQVRAMPPFRQPTYRPLDAVLLLAFKAYIFHLSFPKFGACSDVNILNVPISDLPTTTRCGAASHFQDSTYLINTVFQIRNLQRVPVFSIVPKISEEWYRGCRCQRCIVFLFNEHLVQTSTGDRSLSRGRPVNEDEVPKIRMQFGIAKSQLSNGLG